MLQSHSGVLKEKENFISEMIRIVKENWTSQQKKKFELKKINKEIELSTLTFPATQVPRQS